MKNVRTNFEKMGNIVGRNMVSMDKKINQEVVQQLNSRVESKTIEDRMKKFEKTIKNVAATGSCNVTSASRTIQPATYGGQTLWLSYMKQFEAAVTAIFLEEEQKAVALVIVCEVQR